MYDEARMYEALDSLLRDEQEATRTDGATKRASRRKRALGDEERRSDDGRNSTEPGTQPNRPRRLKRPNGRKAEHNGGTSGKTVKRRMHKDLRAPADATAGKHSPDAATMAGRCDDEGEGATAPATPAGRYSEREER